MLTLVEAKKSTTSKPFRVILVHNQEIIRHRLRNLLNNIDGFDVVAEASNCSEVLKWAATVPINLVSMDASMADADIMETVQALRNMAHPPHIVIFSATMNETSPDNRSNATFDKLTPQEYNVLQLMGRGLSNKQIAARLSISPYTVGKHVQQVLHKLGVVNRTQAAAYTLF